MNRTILLMAAVAATIVMTSCSNDDDAVNNNERVEVKFTAGNIADVQTRVDGTNWNGGEYIGIYMLKSDYSLSDGNISEGVANRKYEAASGGTATFSPVGGTSNTIYYPVAGDVKFIAYYPHSTAINTYKLDVAVGNQAVQSDIDVLYAKTTAVNSKTVPAVTLPFAHKLVKLVFNISKDVSVTAPLTDLEVKITSQPTTGKLNLVNGEIGDLGIANNEITALTATGGASSEAIVLPGSTSGVKFTFYNGTDAAFEASVPDQTWVGGNKYTYTVVLKKTGAAVTGTIEAWGAGNAGETFDAE